MMDLQSPMKDDVTVSMTKFDQIKTRILESEPFAAFAQRVASLSTSRVFAIRGVSGSLFAFISSALSEKFRQVLVVMPDDDQAEEFRDDCALLVGENTVSLFTQSSTHRSRLLDATPTVERVRTLRGLSSGERIVVAASAGALAGKIPEPRQFNEGILTVESGQSRPFEEFINRLGGLGFERKDFVEEHGDFAVRGGIVDVFPYAGENPVRLEFWGDSIESIREFDPLSQRSIKQLQSATLTPGIQNGSTASLLDYLADDAVVVVCEPELTSKEIDELFSEGVTGLFTWQQIQESLSNRRIILHSSLDSTSHNVLNFQSSPQSPYNGSIKLLGEHIAKLCKEQYEIVLSCDTEEEAERLRELLETESSNKDLSVEYDVIKQALHSGFMLPSARIAILTEHQIFGRRKRRGSSKRTKFKGISQKDLRQLHRGDYVVHVDYGIGKFSGLQKLKVRGVEQEVMKVLYAEKDVLYVNLNFINRVQKYSSREGHIPTLTKLGSPDWERLKSRVRKKIKDVARDLIKLYARRKHEEGFSFATDTAWQKEMEASFMYEDTPDQFKATVDVKRDMENTAPMDRLICGDVGFGKTEVAVRAAFKAVMDGKQVAVLVPTTILAQQHFNTFVDRLGKYSVRIESLSRFRSRKEQQDIVQGLKEGRVDIVIGTHRLLSKDVHFKDLGLLIVDEEHRFGVSSKEKLRQLRAAVDTLTLTATPIPRTLQFSLMGARDLSLINTPPRNRLPIITEIAQFDLALIREAILKELHRGGQVYFIHDRIQNIEDMQSLLEEHIPEARFHVAHGQMKGHELEKAMLDFLAKKHDVLLCTKIIESGIDIPSVNTIIINRADRFGLAELYQLRGRVGRSNVRAFAYLLTPPISSLPKDSIRRLQAIQDFTELGSGFNLAMRDMEIRGAGNLLGAEQSGFIAEMGFEMYQRVLEETVTELKEEEFGIEKTAEQTPKEDTVVDADVDAYIPDFYVESDSERLDLYRRLYQAKDSAALEAMQSELKDRFGEYPPEVENLVQLVGLKILAGSMGFAKLELTGDKLILTLPSQERKEFYEGMDGQEAPFQAMMKKVGSLKANRPRLIQMKKVLQLEAVVGSNDDPAIRIRSVKEFLQNLSPPSN